jgi:TetR/AcrR family transcriptional regulator, transcriptional repressor of bet genes
MALPIPITDNMARGLAARSRTAETGFYAVRGKRKRSPDADKGNRLIVRARPGRPPVPALRESRRRQLVSATIGAIAEFGFAEASVVRIANIAGISAGQIHHYFGGKDGLLEAAMRSILTDMRAASAQALATAQRPADRLKAIVSSNLHPRIFRRDISIAWLSFWAQATHETALARIERINRARLRSNLRDALKPIVGLTRSLALADIMAMTIDGLWVAQAHVNPEMDAEAAQKLVLQIVNL